MTKAAEQREQRMLRRYNLTLEDYHAMLEECGHKCPGCRKRFNDTTRLPCIDHNHETGLVRGLLCFNCNREIGTHHDNADWFRNIANYLTNPPSLDCGIEVYVPGSPGAEGVLT